MDGRRKGKIQNQCLTMHQPWASLLLHGIKRIEGRSWPAPIRGRLWIHAASKVPDDTTIKAMEDFYKEIHAVNGITDLRFPEHYPVSSLLGCIEVVGCLRCEELACWKNVPEAVRLEGLTPFCWLCERPQMLPFPIEMRGFHGIYDLDRKIFDAAVGSLVPVESPLPVKFQLPNPRDNFSLKPGSVSICFPESKAPEVQKSPKLIAAISGARAAAGQFSKKEQGAETKSFKSPDVKTIYRPRQENNRSLVEHRMAGATEVDTRVHHKNDQTNRSAYDGRRSSHAQAPCPEIIRQPKPSSKLHLPRCTSLTPDGIIRAVETLTKPNHKLTTLKIDGIPDITKQHLDILHSILQKNIISTHQKPIFFHKSDEGSSSGCTSPPLDVDLCPVCDQVRGFRLSKRQQLWRRQRFDETVQRLFLLHSEV